jgi:hypothetical protein
MKTLLLLCWMASLHAVIASYQLVSSSSSSALKILGLLEWAKVDCVREADNTTVLLGLILCFCLQSSGICFDLLYLYICLHVPGETEKMHLLIYYCFVCSSVAHEYCTSSRPFHQLRRDQNHLVSFGSFGSYNPALSHRTLLKVIDEFKMLCIVIKERVI